MVWTDVSIQELLFYAMLFVAFCFGFISAYRP